MQATKIKKYDTYKDSGIEWIGEIPQEWNTITLKRVFSNRDGGAWGEEAQNNENDRICIRIADFDYPKMTIKHDIDYTVRNYATDVIEKLTLQKNDILIEKSGGGDQTPVGRTIIFNEDFNALYANFMDRLRVKQSISPKFIQYLLVSFYQNGITYQYIKQTTGIQNLDLTNLLAKESIVLPILDKQQRIADYLDKKCGEIDRVVEAEKSVIEKLKEYKQSIITEAVTKGLDKSVPLKDSGIEWIGKIPQHWEVSRFKFLGKFTNGYAFPSDSFTENGIKVMKITNIQPMQISWEDSSYISYEWKLKAKDYIVPQNALVFALTRPIISGGIKVSIYEDKDEVLLNQRNAMFNGNNKITTSWLYYIMLNKLFIQEFNMKIDRTGQQPNISTNEIANIYITVPNINEQQQIVSYLDKKCSEIDKAIADKEQLIEKITEYKKSLIYECVTGKRKVV